MLLSRIHRPRWLDVPLKALLTGLIVWMLTRKVDLGQILDLILAQSGPLFAAAAAVALGQLFMHTLRWRVCLASLGHRFPFRPLAVIMAISFFFNQVLPTNVGGDLIRGWKLHRRGLGVSPTVNGILLERLLHLAGLLLLLVATAPLLAVRLPGAAPGWLLPTLTVGFLATALLVMRLDLLSGLLRRLPGMRSLAALASDARTVFLHPTRLLGQLALSLLGHGLFLLCFYILARGLDLPVGALDILALMPPVLLAMTLPITINSWGVRESAALFFLQGVGVAPASALALSVSFGLAVAVSRLPGGVVLIVEALRRDRSGPPAPGAGSDKDA